MKKYFLFILLTSVFIFSGCSLGKNTSTTSTTLRPPERVTLQGSVQREADKRAQEEAEQKKGYYIQDELLWHDNVQLTTTTLTALGLEPLGDEIHIWHESIKTDGDVQLYIMQAGGCDDCTWITPYYFTIDTQTNSVEFKKSNAINSFIGKTRNPLYIASSDHEQIAFIQYESTDQLRYVRSEKVYLVNIVTDTVTKTIEIKPNETVTVCGKEMPGMCNPDIRAIYFSTNLNDQGELVVKPIAYNPAAFIYQDKDSSLSDVCIESDACDGLLAFQPRQIVGRYINNGFLLSDTARGLIVDDMLANARYTHSLLLYPIDFDGDKVNEFMLYYHDMNNGHPTLQGDNIKVYQYDGAKWTTIYELHEGYTSGVADSYALIERETFLDVQDTDADGYVEAVISLDIEVSGSGPTNREYVVLEWNGTKLIEKRIK